MFYQDLLGGYLAFVNQMPAVFYVKEEIIVKETSLTEARCLAESGGAVPIVRQLLADMVTPLGLMSLIRKDHDRYFLLESLEASMLGAATPLSAMTAAAPVGQGFCRYCGNP